jgi:hypothetical protein
MIFYKDIINSWVHAPAAGSCVNFGTSIDFMADSFVKASYQALIFENIFSLMQ